MIEKLRNGLIVECIAPIDRSLHEAEYMVNMAKEAISGGAKALRVSSVSDIKAIKEAMDVIVIGNIKKKYDNSDVVCTPTTKEVLELVESGCDIIAIDATRRQRPSFETVEDLLEVIKRHKKLALADISNYDEGVVADILEFDLISTALSGATSYTHRKLGPNLKLIKKLVKKVKTPILAEGRINTKEEMLKLKKIAPYAVVIASTIPNPSYITKSFLNIYKS